MKITNFLANNIEKNKMLFGSTVKINNQKNEKNEQKDNNNITMNLSQNIDEIVKSLQERIEMVKQNEKYDEKTKKYKIEQIQSKIDELNELKTIKELESVLNKKDEIEKKKAENDKEEVYTDKNEDGDTYLSNEDAKMIVSSQVSLEKISYYSGIKARMASEAHMLKSEEIKSGFTTQFKTNLSDKLTRGITRLEMAKNLEIGNINNSVRTVVEEKTNEVKSTNADIVKNIKDQTSADENNNDINANETNVNNINTNEAEAAD